MGAVPDSAVQWIVRQNDALVNIMEDDWTVDNHGGETVTDEENTKYHHHQQQQQHTCRSYF